MITEAEAAAMIGVRPHTLAVWRSTGRYDLSFFKPTPRTVLYERREVEAFCRRNRIRRGAALVGI
jgi:hypothetical protein